MARQVAVTTILVVLLPFVISSSPDRRAHTPDSAGHIRVGAIRWDDWAGPGLDVTQDAPIKCLSPPQWHYRLPFFAQVINSSAVTWHGATQDVIDKEINYASDGGLSYWAFCTYPTARCDQDAPSSQESCPLSWALERYLSSQYNDKINFSLILQAHWNSWPNISAWPEKVERYSSYFAMNNYEKVLDGRPLVFLFGMSEGSLAPWGGSTGFKPALDKLTQASVSTSGKEPYYCLMGNNKALADKLNISCATTYAVSGGTVQGSPYSEQMTAAKNFWESCRQAGSDVIPQAPTGWDPRPRYYNPPPWQKKPHQQGLNHYINATADEVAAMLKMGIDWVEANPNATLTRHLLMYAWNEGSEGGWLWPTLEEGTKRLDAIKEVIQQHRDSKRTP